jgi:hypothetical protein
MPLVYLPFFSWCLFWSIYGSLHKADWSRGVEHALMVEGMIVVYGVTVLSIIFLVHAVLPLLPRRDPFSHGTLRWFELESPRNVGSELLAYDPESSARVEWDSMACVDDDGRAAVLSRGSRTEMVAVILKDLASWFGLRPEEIIAVISDPDDARQFASRRGTPYWVGLATASERPLALRREAVEAVLSAEASSAAGPMAREILTDPTSGPLRLLVIPWLTAHQMLSQGEAIELLTDEDPAVVTAALDSLGRTCDDAGAEVVGKYTTDPRAEVAAAARAALERYEDRALARDAHGGLSPSDETGTAGALSQAREPGALSEAEAADEP